MVSATPATSLSAVATAESPVYVDPFHEGIRLDREELLAQACGISHLAAPPRSPFSPP